MKTTTVTIAGVKGIRYGKPESLEELQAMISTDAKKGIEVVLNAATQYFLQQNLIRVRSKIAEHISKKFEVKPKLFIGTVEVEAELDKDGETVTGYKSIQGKKNFKADAVVKTESDKDFIDRVVTEKAITPDKLASIVQKIADANPFIAERKRERGSVASKPVGAKWTKLAEKIIKAGNGKTAADKLTKEIGQVVDVSGDDAVKRLALALAEKSRLSREAEEKEAAELAGTAETPLVVDGTK